VFGWNNSINLGGSVASTAGLATSSFTGGRTTNITGLEMKMVTGLDAKSTTGDVAKRSIFNINLDDANINKTGVGLKFDDLDAAQKGLSANLTSTLMLFS
jgi:hypothetical protein